MRIICDTREQNPFYFDHARYNGAEIERAALQVGDYSVAGFTDKIAIERKGGGLEDLVSCLMGSNRERFERELQRARALDVFAVVVEASFLDLVHGRYRSEMSAKAAVQSVMAFQVRWRVPFIWAGNRQAAELVTYSMLEKYLHEIEKRFEQASKSQPKEAKA